MITIVKTSASEGVSSCELVPAVNGMTIEVPAGSVLFERIAYELTEAEEVTLVAGQDVTGYLVEEEDGGLRLFVFSWPHDGSGIDFDPVNYPTLKFRHVLFIVSVPVGTTDLNDLNMNLFHVVKATTKPRAGSN